MVTTAPLKRFLTTPTQALSRTLPCPADEEGRCWRSRISDVLEARARDTGHSELQVLTAFLKEMGVAPLVAAKIEAGRLAPSQAYRERAARVLGMGVAELFEEIADAPDGD